MEEPQLFIMDSEPLHVFGGVNNNYESSHDVLSRNFVEHQQQLEEELGVQEKALFLCSELGLFLVQEVNNLLMQKKNLVNDHTKVLLDLQSYESLKKSFLDLADTDAASELNDTLSTFSPEGGAPAELNLLKNRFQNGSSTNVAESMDKLYHLQNQIFNMGSSSNVEAMGKTCGNRRLQMIDDLHLNHSGVHSALQRSGSVESLTEVRSIPESTLTAYSHVTKNLQSDLTKLQRAHERITRLEVQLDSTRVKYRTLMTDYSRKLKEISESLGPAVDRARPYFDAVTKARKAQVETQQATIQYKRAVNLQKAGRDMVKVAEERLSGSADKFDTTWQEMLNQATLKVNEASREKDRIHRRHMKAAKQFEEAEESKSQLQTSLQRSIVRAKPYFEVQQDFQMKLEKTTKRLNALEVRLMEAKQSYSDALTSIRQSGDGEGSSLALDSLAERGIGVGAENPYMDGSVLPKPMQDILRMEAMKNSSTNIADKQILEKPSDHTALPSRFQYNPYDMMYLKNTSPDNASTAESLDDDYIQDF